MIFAQQKIQVGSMTFEAWLMEEEMEIELRAPTEGWIAVGFNQSDAILGADLLQFRVHDSGEVYAEDQLVTDFGKHPTDVSLGGTDDIKIMSGEERDGQTSIRFRIPFSSGDPSDFSHQLNHSFWLILAYSVSDDFDHHSIMRKHFSYQWKKE